MQRCGTIIQFMFGTIHYNKVLHQQHAKKNSKIFQHLHPQNGAIWEVPMGQKVEAVTKTLF